MTHPAQLPLDAHPFHHMANEVHKLLAKSTGTEHARIRKLGGVLKDLADTNYQRGWEDARTVVQVTEMPVEEGVAQGVSATKTADPLCGPGKTHVLKTWPEYFGSMLDGTKNFEIRKNDRDFKVGDYLNLREFWPTSHGAGAEYSGRSLTLAITYIMHGPVFGLADGWVIMGLRVSL